MTPLQARIIYDLNVQPSIDPAEHLVGSPAESLSIEAHIMRSAQDARGTLLLKR